MVECLELLGEGGVKVREGITYAFNCSSERPLRSPSSVLLGLVVGVTLGLETLMLGLLTESLRVSERVLVSTLDLGLGVAFVEGVILFAVFASTAVVAFAAGRDGLAVLPSALAKAGLTSSLGFISG